MPMPIELRALPDDTVLIGDVEALLQYIESGQAAQDYQRQIANSMAMLIEMTENG